MSSNKSVFICSLRYKHAPGALGSRVQQWVVRQRGGPVPSAASLHQAAAAQQLLPVRFWEVIFSFSFSLSQPGKGDSYQVFPQRLQPNPHPRPVPTAGYIHSNARATGQPPHLSLRSHFASPARRAPFAALHMRNTTQRPAGSMEAALRRELGIELLRPTGHSGGGCISQGQSYDTDHGRVFVKSNAKAEVWGM